MSHEYQPGQHGCPVNCQYCVITEVESRRERWNARTILGINKSVTILNPPPDKKDTKALQEFYDFPVEILKGDIVGFNGISDPFWPKYRPELYHFLDKVPQVAKLVTCVTKFNPPDEVLDRLARIPNYRLIVSITGLDMLEQTKTRARLDLLARAKQKGITAFPIVHPYIAGMSDLSFLPVLRDLGYGEIDVKGLRFNQGTMGRWMPEAVQQKYLGYGDQEVLPEDGWRKQIAVHGINKISLNAWYRKGFEQLEPHLTNDEATSLVKQVISMANITSSDADEAVAREAIARRL